MRQEIKGNGGQITQNGHVIVCHGGTNCPMHRRAMPQSAQDEAEFHKLTGIRTGSYRVRELLEEFRARHNLTWRGRGIARLWKNRTLEYDEARDVLKLNANFGLLLWGWFCTGFVSLFLVTIILLATYSTKSVAWQDWAKVGAAFVGHLILLYLSVEYMLMPEVLARRIRKRDLAARPDRQLKQEPALVGSGRVVPHKRRKGGKR